MKTTINGGSDYHRATVISSRVREEGFQPGSVVSRQVPVAQKLIVWIVVICFTVDENEGKIYRVGD